MNGSLNIEYEYDEIGNLKLSEENGVEDTIKWTVYGKVAQVIRKKGTDFMTINYRYDGSGNRVMKLLEKRMSGTIEFTTTHYILDATGGNILATYTNRQVQELNIYGSSRLGTYKIPYEPDPNDNTKQVQKDDFHKLILGRRSYELTNHLGNVLAVISDKKILNGTTFEADVVATNDYYPFGMTIASRTFQSEEYRFGFNGAEKMNEITQDDIYDLGLRFYDTRIVRMFKVDLQSGDYSWQSPYVYHRNSPIFMIDYLGGGDRDSEDPKETKVGIFFRKNVPGLVAAPLGGTIDMLAGISKTIFGIFNKEKRRAGARNALGGFLSIFGLKEVLMEKNKSRAPTSTALIPYTLDKEMDEMQKRAWTQVKNPDRNGMHAWHAGTNAALTNKLGPVGGFLIWLGGIFHETPFDRASFRAEQRAQGTINHIIDSVGDIVANTVGYAIGLLLPKKWAKGVSVWLGNQIPGPGDPDPHGTGGGGYTGNPTKAWGQWPGSKRR